MSTESFDVLAHLDALRRYARALCRDQGLADDLVQEAMLRAYAHRRSFDPAKPLRVWLFAVLRNAYLAGLERRRSDRTKQSSFADVAETEVRASQDHAVRLAQVRARFETLPDAQREVIHLVGIDGLSYREAADVLGIPLGTLMSRLGRARAALRAYEDGTAARPNLRVIGGTDQ